MRLPTSSTQHDPFTRRSRKHSNSDYTDAPLPIVQRKTSLKALITDPERVLALATAIYQLTLGAEASIAATTTAIRPSDYLILNGELLSRKVNADIFKFNNSGPNR